MNPVASVEDTSHDRTAIDPIEELPLAYVEIDARGIITRANRRSLALHSLECGQLVGKMAWDLVAPDEKDPSFAAYCSSLETGAAAAVVRRSLYDRTGQFRTYDMHRSLVRDAGGNPAGMRMVCVDVTEAEKALEDARRKSDWLESVMDSIGEAIVVTDAVGFIRLVNPAAEGLLGRKAGELIGKPIEEGLPVVSYHSGERNELVFTMALESRSEGIATVLDRNRCEIKIGIDTSPISDRETGSTSGIVLLLHQLEISG